MQVLRFSTLDQLSALAAHWDRLSHGVPFRSWAWMSNWWRHYGLQQTTAPAKPSLFTLGVFDRSGTPVGIAPWYREYTASQGHVLRFLGTGEVCSEYLSVLCQSGMEDRVTTALADWLTDAGAGELDRSARGNPDAWDLLELTGVDAEDGTMQRLAEQLSNRGNTVHCRPGPGCWRIELPGSWDEYLATLSKSHRKQVRRMERNLLATDRAVVHGVERLVDLPKAQEILIDLHQRRRRSLGEPGCFSSRRFAAFHRDVMPQLLRNGKLHLTWVDLDGQPVAAEYELIGDGVVYAYQGGVNPARLEHSPGHLSCLVTLRRAIEQGYRAVDFLRGDEPYKAHWRAKPRHGVEIRVAASRISARVRHKVWLVGSRVKRWINQMQN